MYAIETRRLVKTYGRQRAVDDFSMHVPEGAIYGFVGKNGAGKSTVMKMVDCMVAPTSGEVFVFGKSIDSGAGMNAVGRIGALIEAPGLIGGLSAFDNLMAKALAIGIPNARARCQEVLQLVGLDTAGKKHARKFSQGMKQRLGIGLALLGSPDILLLDEPFNGLDPEGTRDLRNMIVRLNKMLGVTVVVSSHVLDQLDRMATCYGVIAQGHMIAEASTEEVRAACGDSIIVRTTSPERTLAQLERCFPEYSFTMEPGDTIKIRGTQDLQAVAEMLHEVDTTVLELSESHRDIEEYFVELMEGGRS